MWTIAIDDPVAWASVCHADDCCYSFPRWRHFNVAIYITVSSCLHFHGSFQMLVTKIHRVFHKLCLIQIKRVKIHKSSYITSLVQVYLLPTAYTWSTCTKKY